MPVDQQRRWHPNLGSMLCVARGPSSSAEAYEGHALRRKPALEKGRQRHLEVLVPFSLADIKNVGHGYRAWIKTGGPKTVVRRERNNGNALRVDVDASQEILSRRFRNANHVRRSLHRCALTPRRRIIGPKELRKQLVDHVKHRYYHRRAWCS